MQDESERGYRMGFTPEGEFYIRSAELREAASHVWSANLSKRITKHLVPGEGGYRFGIDFASNKRFYVRKTCIK